VGAKGDPIIPTAKYCPATSAKSEQALYATLSQAGLPDGAASHKFISEIFARAPRKSKHKATSDTQRHRAEKDAKTLSSKKFEFLLEEEETPSSSRKEKPARTKAEKSERASKEKKDRSLRKREADGREWESDEEDKIRKRARFDEEPSRYDDELDPAAEMEDEEDRRERERIRDLQERDEFAERVKQRDKEKAKQLVEDRSTRGAAAQEALSRRQLADDVAARVAAMPSLRERSRQEYLTKREIQQIELLKREIADEEALFHGMKITKREQQELEYKKEVLRLAEERMKIDDRYDGYYLPEDYLTEQGKIDKRKKESVLYQRYEENKAKDDQFVTDVDKWESAQAKNSTFKTGALDKPELAETYDYVFDESQTIKFVMDKALEGENFMSEADRLLQQQIDAAEQHGTYSF
jgi:hypothetical protein